MKIKLSLCTFSLATAILLPTPVARGTVTLYVSSFPQTIDTVSSTGVVSPFATAFNPAGLAIDPDGNLYAADYLTNQISKITPGGMVSNFASVPSPHFIAIAVPEPSRALLLVLGGVSLLMRRRRNKLFPQFLISNPWRT